MSSKPERRWMLANKNGHLYGTPRHTRSKVIDEQTAVYTGGDFAGKTRQQKWRLMKRKWGVSVVQVEIREVQEPQE